MLVSDDQALEAELLVAKHYRRWGRLAQLGRLSDGWDNDNFLITNEVGRRSVLRRYRLSSNDEVRAEVELLKTLNGVQFPTPQLVLADSSEALLSFSGANWVMSEYLANTRYPSDAEWPVALELMHRLHVVGAGFHGPAVRKRFSSLPARLSEAATGGLDRDDLDFLWRVIDEERSRFGASLDRPNESVRSSCVHYDVNPRNVLIDEAGRAWLIDFDELVFAPITVDLAGFIHYWCISEAGSFDAARAQRVVQAYCSHGALTADERARLPGELLRYQLRDCLKYCLNELAYSPSFQLRQSTSFSALQQVHAVVCHDGLEFEDGAG